MGEAIIHETRFRGKLQNLISKTPSFGGGMPVDAHLSREAECADLRLRMANLEMDSRWHRESLLKGEAECAEMRPWVAGREIGGGDYWSSALSSQVNSMSLGQHCKPRLRRARSQVRNIERALNGVKAQQFMW